MRQRTASAHRTGKLVARTAVAQRSVQPSTRAIQVPLIAQKPTVHRLLMVHFPDQQRARVLLAAVTSASHVSGLAVQVALTREGVTVLHPDDVDDFPRSIAATWPAADTLAVHAVLIVTAHSQTTLNVRSAAVVSLLETAGVILLGSARGGPHAAQAVHGGHPPHLLATETVTFPGQASDIGGARGFLRNFLALHGIHQGQEMAARAAGRLVTAALKRGSGPIRLTATLTPGLVRVEVASGHPVPQQRKSQRERATRARLSL